MPGVTPSKRVNIPRMGKSRRGSPSIRLGLAVDLVCGAWPLGWTRASVAARVAARPVLGFSLDLRTHSDNTTYPPWYDGPAQTFHTGNFPGGERWKKESPGDVVAPRSPTDVR